MINGLDGTWHGMDIARIPIAQARFDGTHGTTQHTRRLNQT